MADIFEPAEFKRVFEQSEKYAPVAVEIKKLTDTKNELKRTSELNGVLKVDRKIKEVLLRLHRVLSDWERGLSPRFKQLSGSRGVMKTLQKEMKINEQNLKRSASNAGKEVEKKKKSAGLVDEMRKLDQMLHKAGGQVKEIDEFLTEYKKISADIKKGAASPQALQKLQSMGEPLHEKKEHLSRTLPDLDQKYTSIAKGEQGDLSPIEKSKVKDACDKLHKHIKKFETFNELDKIIGDVKGGQQKLKGDKESWMKLAKEANDMVFGMSKSGLEIGSLIDNSTGKIKGLESQFPSSNNPELAKKLPDLREIDKHLKGVPPTIQKRYSDLESTYKAFLERQKKVLKSEAYESQKKNDKAIADAGKALEKNSEIVSSSREKLAKKLEEYKKAVESANKLVGQRISDYEKLGKK